MQHYFRQTIRLPAVGMALLAASNVPAATDMISAQASWKIWEDTAVSENWYEPQFDDSSWKRGHRDYRFQKGTSYLRLTFNAEAPTQDVLDMELRIRGMNTSVGFAAYLNGRRVELRRLPEGFNHDTPPDEFPYPTFFTAAKRGLDPNIVRDGTNVLAITLHTGKMFAEEVKSFSPEPALVFLTDNDNQLVAGPVVNGAYMNRAVLTFEMLMPGTAVLKYGKLGQSKDTVLTSPDIASIHEMVVENLDPETIYEYDLAIRRAGGEEALCYSNGRFRTASRNKQEFTFGVFADPHNSVDYGDPASSRLAGAMMADESLEFIVGLGDFVENGGVNETSQDYFFGPWRDMLATKPFWAAIGNHDWGGTGQTEYCRAMFPCVGDGEFYTFVYGCARFVVINPSSEYGIVPKRPEQLKSLEKVLLEANDPYLFVLEHQSIICVPPVCPPNSPTGLTVRPGARVRIPGEYLEKVTEWPHLFPLEHQATPVPSSPGAKAPKTLTLRPGVEVLMPLLEKCNATAFLVGHNHYYQHVQANGFSHVICAGGRGYMRVGISPEKAVVELIDLSGKTVDTFDLLPRER